jgi:sterol 14-demethylase
MPCNLACWTLLYLSANKQWKEKAIVEVQNLMAAHTNTISSEPIHQRLSMIPISAWEDEMPVVEGIIRETLRLVKNDTALRRNLVDNVHVADKTIDKGAFMAYNFGDVHLNELFYSEPLKFDPDRFSPPREEDKRGNAVFLGWGTGRHPCAGQGLYLYIRLSQNVSSGMKFAKLEIKMILALILSRYEYELVDVFGKPPKQLPQPNRNDIHQVCQSL